MANKPESFSQDKIRRETISPEELDSWVSYVHEEKYESLKQAGIEISKEDIHITVNLHFSKNNDGNGGNYVTGNIFVETVRPGGFASCYVIAPFAYSSDAIKTFENYAKFKNVSIIERDSGLLARREISV